MITPFFTRLISREEYGELTLYLTLLGIASVVCSTVSSGSVIYRGLKNHENKTGTFLKSSLLISLSLSALICLLLFAFSPFVDINPNLFLPLAIQVLCDTAVSVALSEARYKYKYKQVVAIGLITSVLPALISVFVLGIFGLNFRVKIYSMLIISIFTAFFSLKKICDKEGKVAKDTVFEICKSALPLVPHGIANALTAQSDKLILSSILGAAALAKYSVVHSLGIGLQFAVSAIGSALSPWMIRRLSLGDRRRISELSTLLLSGFSALTLVLIALAPEAMKILAPKEYFDAFPAILPIALTVPISLIFMITTVTLVHSERGGYVSVLTLIGAVLGVLLNFMLIENFLYFGAGLSLLITQIFGAILGMFFLKKSGLEDVINLSESIKNFALTVAVATLLFFLRDNLSARVFLLTIPAVILLNDFFSAKKLVLEKGSN